jgi:hypothetical protein
MAVNLTIAPGGNLAVAKDHSPDEDPHQEETQSEGGGDQRKRHGKTPRHGERPRAFHAGLVATDVKMAHSVRASRHSMPYTRLSTPGWLPLQNKTAAPLHIPQTAHAIAQSRRSEAAVWIPRDREALRRLAARRIPPADRKYLAVF